MNKFFNDINEWNGTSFSKESVIDGLFIKRRKFEIISQRMEIILFLNYQISEALTFHFLQMEIQLMLWIQMHYEIKYNTYQICQ